MPKKEEYITKKDGKFYIIREINGKKINFGSYSTLKKAIEIRDELEYDGWPIKTKKLKKSLPQYIEKEGRKYIVYRYFNNEKKIYGNYKSLKDAEIAKSNLMSNGWESDLYHSDSKYGKYISKQYNKFAVSRVVNGELINFGYFKTLEDAINSRDQLVANNWGKYDLKPQGLYGKYITREGEYYCVRKIIDGHIRSFGSFKTVKEAIKTRDKNIKEGWKNPISFDFDRNIHKTSQGYTIFKRVDGILECFGTFDTREEAIAERDLLITNNWELFEEENDNICEIDNNVYYNGEYYTIERTIDGNTYVYGVFKNKELAIKEKDKLIFNDWNSVNAIKTYQYPYGENIVPYDYIFFLEKEINGENKNFGTFYSFQKVIEAKDELNRKNWNINDDIIFEDIINIFNFTKLIVEPKIPFPQADLFEIFIKICEELKKSNLNKEYLCDIFNLNPRQYSFYMSAGKYLGLICNYDDLKGLTQEGKEIFLLNENKRNLELVKLILEHKPFYDVFSVYLENKELPSSNTIFNILKNNDIYNVNSDVTLKRRSTTVRGWINWIINLY